MTAPNPLFVEILTNYLRQTSGGHLVEVVGLGSLHDFVEDDSH